MTRFLAMFEAGRTQEEASEASGVRPATVRGWLARGRREAKGPYHDFACQFDAIREGKGSTGLSEADLIRLLERQARRGSVQSIKLLLERPWERKKADDDEERSTETSPLSAVDELATQRARRAV